MSFDDEAANAAFARKYDFPFPLLCDTDRRIGLAYGACDSPEAGYAHRVSYLIGPDGRIRRAYDKVDTSKHAAEILIDLDADSKGSAQ